MIGWSSRCPCRCCALLVIASAVACRTSASSSAREDAREAAPDAVSGIIAGTAGWSAPRALTDARGRTLALWAPSLATWRDALVLAGNVVNLEGMVGPGSLGGHDLAMERRPRALDTLHGLYPRVVIAPGTGVRHLLWAEPATSDSLGWLSPARSLWHATITPAGEWSEPARVLEDYQVHWAPTLSSPPVFDADGTLHAAVAVWSTTTGNNVVHLALEPTGWRITPIHDGTTMFAAMHTAIGIADNGHLAVSWVAHAREPGGPPSAAQVTFSEDRGRSWSTAVRLDTATHEESGQLRLVGLQNSFVALWGRYGAATFPLESIHRAVVRAGTRAVVRLPPIQPGYPIYGPETIRDACGTIHLVVRHVAGPATHADYARLSFGADTLQHVDPDVPVSEVDIAAGGGAIALGWVGRIPSGEFVSQVRTRPMLCGR